jgi:hypothetical protein
MRLSLLSLFAVLLAASRCPRLTMVFSLAVLSILAFQVGTQLTEAIRAILLVNDVPAKKSRT